MAKKKGGSCTSGGNGSVRRLDTAYFKSAIHELSAAVKDFHSALNRVDKSTKSIQSCWEGKGKNKFDDAYWRLKREFDDQHETLSALRDDLQAMLETYEGWDQSMKSSIAGNSTN